MDEIESSHQKLDFMGKLQKYAIRTLRQLLTHIIIALFIAVILGIFTTNNYVMNKENFVTIASSMSAASGALFAITLALATFFSRHVTDWRDKLVDKLKEAQQQVERQMEKSARLYPEISNRLVDLFLYSVSYIKGQKIDVSEIYSDDKIFSDWAVEKITKSGRKFSFGDLNTYDSFEKHLFDAHLRSTDLRTILIELSVAEQAGRPITTFSPLIITWAIISIFTLLFAILGSLSIIQSCFNLPILFIPFYLFIVAIFALTKDVTAILRHMRILEIGHEKAMVSMNKSEVLKSVKDNLKNNA